MAEGLVLPYLDIPFQHATPKVLKAMRRPANEAKVLERLKAGARSAPTSRSAPASSSASPARPRRISSYLLDWLEEAQLDRVGAFRFETGRGRRAPTPCPTLCPRTVKEER